MINKCHKSFISQYAFVNKTQMHIDDCDQTHKGKFKCINGHELVAVIHTKLMKKHFRHKNSEDIEGNHMTLWHSEWQSNFPTVEKCFKCKPQQIKDRIADVVLNDTTIVEIQHSKYEKSEIDNRKHDYNLHGINIIWVVDGNNSINVTVLETSKRVFLEFKFDYWKYEIFTSYDFIYIDINSKIYKINPNMVRSHMVDVEEPKSKEIFINSLKDGVDLWDNEEPLQCNLFIKQQGAGNGKTFGIIKMLEDEDKKHYKSFIYITKQHSAKHIIKTEFESQMKNFTYLKNIEISESNKKYIINYYNELSNIECQIIIATIDSFTYSIGNKINKDLDKFKGIINSIINGHIETSECGVIKFGGLNPKLNKETLLVIDEFQDPPDCYAKAIIRIMRDKYIDVFIVGDRLQSISNEKNAFTYFLESEFPFINVFKIEPTNICRRFTHPKLVEFVNYMIPFEKYILPQINPYIEKLDNNDYEPLIIFKGKPTNFINLNEDNEEIINTEVEKIMSYYQKEVYEYNRFPEDFLIVTPFTRNNTLVDALLLCINIFWKDKFTNEPEYVKKWRNNINIEEYYKYAIFHKSEEGSSIDLSESEYSTRIVSCHSSKGDGRNIVFLIGFTESALERFSQSKNNLVYHSLLHVGLTRMKEKLFIRYENNNDDIDNKITSFFNNNGIYNEDVIPNIKISDKIKYQELIDYSGSNNFEIFYENIIKLACLEDLNENTDHKKIIDMGNHNIRFMALFITILLEIVNNEKNNSNSDIKKQIKAILFKVSTAEIIEVNNTKSYYKLLSNKEETVIIPILQISNKGFDYIRYCKIIFETTEKLQEKLKYFLTYSSELLLCPFECILLYFMIEILDKKTSSSITISDIYNIIDVYDKSFDDIFVGHEKCLCKTHFKKKYCDSINSIVVKTNIYLKNHYDKIRNIKITMKNIFELFPNMNWLINHTVMYNGDDSYKMSKKFQLISYDENNVVNFYIKPQFNSLNYNEILMNSIYDAHLLNNVKMCDKNNNVSENYKKFYNKNIITYVITLDNDKPYLIEFKDSNKKNILLENNDIIINSIYNCIYNKYKVNSNNISYFYNYWKKFCPENKSSPSNFIIFIKEKLNENEKNIPFTYPTYINDFFTEIEFEISHCKGKTNKELILKKYEDKDYFIKVLEKRLDVSIKKWLGIIINDDDDDETELILIEK